MLKLSERARPFLGGRIRAQALRLDAPRSCGRTGTGSCALGAVDIANERTRDGVRAAFEVFLDLEAAQLEGPERHRAAVPTRRTRRSRAALIGDLAGDGAASVALLRVDGRPIAAQVLLYCGGTAYTWKTAFDAEFAQILARRRC